MPFMAERSIRAWHYTRMTDEEVQAMQREGLILSSLEGIKKRLSAQVSAGIILAQNAQRIFESSPFHEQGDIRSGQFWMTSNPISTQSCLVELLLNNWGGEGIYFWQKDTEIKSLLQTIGKARIIEIRAPLDATNSIYSAASNILSTFAGFIGCKSEERGFDFCVTRPLKPEAILHIHSQGDATFEVMGRGYPEGFIETPIE
ncbi:hypothetical protein SAMN02746095_01883 [Acidocella aminolytica 101 = DSM 11237]|nr:hypothetical protein SAMN02746095_01883 [Acidocella aminolytica 101 = DSM 11237]